MFGFLKEPLLLKLKPVCETLLPSVVADMQLHFILIKEKVEQFLFVYFIICLQTEV